jgi:hypothetical protein
MKSELMKRVATITYSNGETTKTLINGTDEEINNYFIGQWFNLGVFPRELMVQAVSVEVSE